MKHALALVVLTIMGAVYAQEAHASAALSVLPQTGVYAVDNTFSFQVTVNTGGVAVNAAEGELSFDRSRIRIEEISKVGSVFTFWTTEPAFSNTDGTIRFAGGTTQPFSGDAGTIFTLKATALSAATTSVRFSSGAVLAADGKGTNILDALEAGAYTIVPREVLAKAEYVAPKNTPDAPVIISTTHPEESVWYSNKAPSFSWSLPQGTTAVRISVNRDEKAVPTIVYVPPIESKQLSDMEEGIWYVHVQARNSFGWGVVSSFRFNIDTNKPSWFSMREIERQDLSDPRVRLSVDFTDDASGVGYFAVRIDTGEQEWWYDNSEHVWASPPLTPGRHLVVMTAYDKAGNNLVSSADVLVLPLDAPSLAASSQSAKEGDPFIVRGTTYPNTRVTVWTQRNNEAPTNEITSADTKGLFSAVLERKVREGVYTVWAQAHDVRGAQSNTSEKITVFVREPALIRIGSAITNVISIIIPLVGVVGMLFFLLLFIRHKYVLFKLRVHKEALEAEETLHSAIVVLRNDILRNLKMLESAQSMRELTKEEHSVARRLKKSLSHAERVVKKEIEDIERAAQ